MALQLGWPLPHAAKDAALMVEMGCRPTMEELESMPQELVNTIQLYSAVKSTIEQGETMRL